MSTSIFIDHVSYALGEEERHVDEIDGLSDFLGRHQMINDPGLWGWGRFRVARQGAWDLAVTAAKPSVTAYGAGAGAASGDEGCAISAVVLCGTRFPTDVDAHADLVGRFLQTLGLTDAVPYGVTLNRCATGLAGLTLAEALVRSGQHGAVLLVASDVVTEPADRLRPFAVFSDGAASCVVTASPGRFALLATASAVDAAAMKAGGEISADLGRRVNARLAERGGAVVGDIRRLAHNNVFKPIVVMKERQAGFRQDQLFLDNIGRVGHVFACDPFINLVDLDASGAIRPGDAVAMGSGVSGARFGALLRMR